MTHRGRKGLGHLLPMVKNVPVNYAIRFSGPVTALTARRVVSSDSAMLHRLAVAKSSCKGNPASFSPSLPRSTFTYFTSLVTLQLARFVCRNSEEQFLMSSRDTRSAAGSAVDSTAEPAASQSPASVPPPNLLGEAPTSQKRKSSQLSTSSQMPSNSLMAPPPRRSRRVKDEDPELGSLPSPPPRRRQAKRLTAMATSG
jgi:hypothetical protein